MDLHLQFNIVCLARKETLSTIITKMEKMTAKLLSEVCHDVQAEPTLLHLIGDPMEYRAAVETN